jgi:hypothetical protein
MRRRGLITLLGGAAAAAPAQQQRWLVVGYLDAQPDETGVNYPAEENFV